MDASKVYYQINSSTTNVTGWVQMTNASSGGSNYYNATLNTSTLADDWYNVTVNATDLSGNQNASVSQPFRIDNTVPALTWIGTTPANNSLQNSTSAYFNLTTNENTANCSMLFDNHWKIMNRWNSTSYNYSILGLADGQHRFNATCNDTAGNNGTSETRNFTVDSTPPTITFVTPTPPNNNVTNNSWVYVNITTSEPTLTALLNWSGSWISMTQFNSTSWYYNKTSLAEGSYTYNVLSNDTANNTGSSETRNVTIELLCHSINVSETWTQDRYKCQNITAENVTVDCNGHTLWLNSASAVGIHGINSQNTIYNASVKNCIIDGGQTGLIFMNSWTGGKPWNQIINNTIRNTYKVGTTGINTYGMYLYGDGLSWDVHAVVENNTIYNITANCTNVGCSASAYGMYLSASVESNYTNNNISLVTGNTSGYGWYAIIDPGVTGTQNNRFRNNNYENIKSLDFYIPVNHGQLNQFAGDTFRNSKQAMYIGDMTQTRIENETIYGSSNTNIGLEINSPVACLQGGFVNNVTIQNVQNTSASVCLQVDAPLAGTWPACNFRNMTMINCSRAVYINGFNGHNMSDSNILNSSYYDLLLTNAYNTTFLNTTFNFSKTFIASANLTVQWYGRVNVTNSTGALTATINDTDIQSNHPFFGYSSLTPFYIVNDSILSSIANMSFNNHTIIVNSTTYNTNTTSFNFSGRDYTVNITLYFVPSVPNLIFVDPTLPTNTTVKQNWVYANITSDLPLTNASLNLNGTIFYMLNSSQFNWYFNATSLPDGVYFYNVTGNTTGSSNFTETRNITLDTTPPVITFADSSPSDFANLNTNNFTICINSSEPLSSATLTFAGINYTMVATNSTFWCDSFVNIPNAQYTYSAQGNDSVNNTGYSETRNIGISYSVGGGGGIATYFCIDGTPWYNCSNVTEGLWCDKGILVQNDSCRINAPPFPAYWLVQTYDLAHSVVPQPIQEALSWTKDSTIYIANQGVSGTEYYLPWLVGALRFYWNAVIGLLWWSFVFLLGLPAWLWFVLLFVFIIVMVLWRRRKGNRRETAKK